LNFIVGADAVDTPRPTGAPVRFSSEDFPEKDRVEAFREVYGRTILSVESQPHKNAAFHNEMHLRALPDLGIGNVLTSPATYRRTHSLLKDDELLLFVFLDGPGSAIQGRRESSIAVGEATLLSGAETGATNHPSKQNGFSFALSEKILGPQVTDIASLFARPIPAATDALRLLVGYTRAIQDSELVLSPQARRLVSTHIYDLAAAALGATRDAHETAQSRGVRAARLRAIKDDIVTHLTQPTLNIEALAKRHGISSRYIRSLFESEETTFTDFGLAARLSHAHKLLLADPFALRKVSDLAAAAGFTASSYFNHAFRRRFGMTPSDARATARQSETDE
jgi:AraC-like DNA-binding protein